MRTIDWIETRKELDGARVGLMGISGGGTVTSFATALEPRIKVAMISGYLNTFKDSIVAMSHCIDNYVPGILNWCENYDVASLIAPRPLYVESGERDNIFPDRRQQRSLRPRQSRSTRRWARRCGPTRSFRRRTPLPRRRRHSVSGKTFESMMTPLLFALAGRRRSLHLPAGADVRQLFEIPDSTPVRAVRADSCTYVWMGLPPYGSATARSPDGRQTASAAGE